MGIKKEKKNCLLLQRNGIEVGVGAAGFINKSLI